MNATRWIPAVTLLVVLGAVASAVEPADANDPNGGEPPAPPATRPRADRLSPDAVELTDEQRRVVEDVRDRDRTLRSNALYVLLGKAMQMPAYGDEKLASLERPSYGRMMRTPAAFRAQPIQLDVYVMTVTELVVGEGLPLRPPLKKGQKVWHISATLVGEDLDASRQMPLILISVADPSEEFGSLIESDTGADKGHFRRAQVAGLFFKTYEGVNRNGQRQVYPVVVVWQIGDRGAMESELPPMQVFGFVIVALLAVGFGYRVLRKHVKQVRDSGKERAKYIPLRDADEPDKITPDREEETPDGPVDPDLAAAAEEHVRRIRGEEDAGDSPRNEDSR
ncbi:MAG: hypothetical protein ACLFV7_08550 [Phycisphaerae bacterium]